jgi:hypothetical protein
MFMGEVWEIVGKPSWMWEIGLEAQIKGVGEVDLTIITL